MIAPRSPSLLALFLAAAVAAPLACSGSQSADVSQTVIPSPRQDLRRFHSRAQLRDYLAALGRANRKRSEVMSGAAEADESPAAAEQAAAPADAKGDAAGGESITNTQEAGVDEGGIVKAHGDHLIVLRRGRLFSIRLSGGSTAPRSVADVSPPGSTKQTWYDEMLVSDDTIVVVGYSYDAGATELGLFDFNGRTGEIKYRTTYLLRSNDYYSSRNYASRLIGDKLIFTPYGWHLGHGAAPASSRRRRPFRRGGAETQSSRPESTATETVAGLHTWGPAIWAAPRLSCKPPACRPYGDLLRPRRRYKVGSDGHSQGCRATACERPSGRAPAAGRAERARWRVGARRSIVLGNERADGH